MPAFGVKKATIPVDSGRLHILLAQRLQEFYLINNDYSDHIDFSSSQRIEGKSGIRLKIQNEYLFFWYEDREVIKMAETPGEILDIGRRGIRRWKRKEIFRHNNK